MKRITVLMFMLIAFISCNSNNEKHDDAKAIADLEHKVLTDAKSINPSTADSLVSMYKQFAEAYPQDTLSPAYLYRAADILANRKECLPAIDLLDKIEEKYPQSDYAPQASFLKGVIFQDVCLNKEKAAESFNAFIAKYPNSPLVNDAKGLLILSQTKDELELIHQWEEKAKEN